jgi:hypothetical protein
LPNKYKCSTGSIFVITIVPDSIKELKALVLKKVVDDLNELSDNGVRVFDKTFHIYLQYICADNLSAHAILGLQGSFRADYCCRYCVMTKDVFQNTFIDSEYKPRDKKAYDEAKNRIMTSEDHFEGFKTITELCEIKHLSLNQICPPDIFHDFLEGKFLFVFFYYFLH